MAPLLVSTGLLALDLPTQNCQVSLLAMREPEPVRTRQNTQPAGSGADGTALSWPPETSAVTGSGARSRCGSSREPGFESEHWEQPALAVNRPTSNAAQRMFRTSRQPRVVH